MSTAEAAAECDGLMSRSPRPMATAAERCTSRTGTGRAWPGVLVFPDAGGARETFGLMGDQLAGLGYVVLVPDIYYRADEWTPFDVATVFTDPAERARMSGLARPLTNDTIIADAGAYVPPLRHVQARPSRCTRVGRHPGRLDAGPHPGGEVLRSAPAFIRPGRQIGRPHHRPPHVVAVRRLAAEVLVALHAADATREQLVPAGHGGEVGGLDQLLRLRQSGDNNAVGRDGEEAGIEDSSEADEEMDYDGDSG